MGFTKHLRIKKEFFNKIRDGSKIYEYRNFNLYYLKYFGIYHKGLEVISWDTDKLIFHYQSEDRILTKIKNIEIIPNNLNSPYLSTNWVLKIEIKLIKN